MKSAALRAQLESALGGRWPSPFTFRERPASETVSSGIAPIDLLTGAGGVPRGALTEIFGPDSSGRTSLLLSLLAQMTAREEACALVDSTDAFDPHSAEAAGVDLRRLLWVRCARAGIRDSGLGVREKASGEPNRPPRLEFPNPEPRTPNPESWGARNVEQSLRVTELLLQGGGFGLVAVDLGDVPPQWARRVPLAFWFRFRRAVENTPTVLVVLDQAPCAKTCASLVLRVEPHAAYWSTAEFRKSKIEIGNSKFETQNSKLETCGSSFEFPISSFQFPVSKSARLPDCASHACLLRGVRLNAEVVRSRLGEPALRSCQFSVKNQYFSQSNNRLQVQEQECLTLDTWHLDD
jgi:hypothetical protein